MSHVGHWRYPERMTTNPVDDRIPQITLGWRLQMSLAVGDLSVQEMADNLGVSRSTISRWLHDDGMPPRAAFVKQWAFATGVSVDWLQTGKDPHDGGPDGENGGLASGSSKSRLLRPRLMLAA